MEELFFEADFLIEKSKLSIFDYMQGDVGIERKRVDDFVQSFIHGKDDHGWDQMNRISQHEGPAYLIIEGDYETYVTYYAEKKVASFKQFYGAIASIAVRYGIPPLIASGTEDDIHESDEDAFVYLCRKIFRSHREGKAGLVRKVKVSPIKKYENVIIALMNTDGIGPENAEAIKEHHNLTFAREILNLNYTKLKEVPTIGPKKAEAIADWWPL